MTMHTYLTSTGYLPKAQRFPGGGAPASVKARGVRLGLLILALGCFALQANAVTNLYVNIEAADLRDQYGNLMWQGGVAALVVDTLNTGLTPLQRAYPLSVGATWGVGKKVIGLWNLTQDGWLEGYAATTYSEGIAPGQKIYLYWFPYLMLGSGVLGNTYYGQYTDQVGLGGYDPWRVPQWSTYPFGNANLMLLTVSEQGPTPDSAAYANLQTVAGNPPVANFTGTPTNGAPPLAVSFSDTSTGTITTRSWNFGDGYTTNITATTVNHTYNSGVYTVTLTATGPDGVSTLGRTNYIFAIPPPPVASFTGAPTNGTAPLTVMFMDSSTGSITNRSWNFGDGATTNITTTYFGHTYTAGTYTVKLIVSGYSGLGTGSSTNTKPNYVVSNPDNSNSWASANSGKWETAANWLLGVHPSIVETIVLVTNANSKTVTVDAVTTNTPGTMTISNLTVSAPIGSTNTLFLNHAGPMPLLVISNLVVGNNGTVIVDQSVLQAADTLLVGNIGGNSALTITNSGAVSVTNAPGNAGLEVRSGTLSFNGGTVTVNQLVLTNGANSVFTFNAGTLATSGTSVSNSLPFVVGDGTHPATLHVYGGVHSFANGLQIRNNASLTGCGTINGNVVVDLGGTIVSDSGCSIVAQQAHVQEVSAFANSTGGLTFADSVTNNGTLRAIEGSVLEIYGTVVNNGTLDLINGSTNFYGTVINKGTVFDANSVKISQAGMSSQDFVLQIPSVSGHTYQLQVSPSLTAPDWKDTGASQAGTDGVLTFTDPGGTTNGPSRFYRVNVTAP